MQTTVALQYLTRHCLTLSAITSGLSWLNQPNDRCLGNSLAIDRTTDTSLDLWIILAAGSWNDIEIAVLYQAPAKTKNGYWLRKFSEPCRKSLVKQMKLEGKNLSMFQNEVSVVKIYSTIVFSSVIFFFLSTNWRIKDNNKRNFSLVHSYCLSYSQLYETVSNSWFLPSISF